MPEIGSYVEKKIKVALFGLGKMGMHHVKAIHLQNSAKLIAIADPDIDSERIRAVLPKDIAIFSKPKDLLQELKPDVVHVCTPPHTHVELATLALKHGANVYVEKPFALKAADARAIISLADNLGLKVCAGHQLLFEKPCKEAQNSIRELGRIVHIKSFFSFRIVRRSLGGHAVISAIDQLVDILPHPVYLLLHFLQLNSGEQEDIAIEFCSLNVSPYGDVHCIIRIGDTIGILVVTLEGRPVDSYIRFVGTNGSLHADFVRSIVIKLVGPGYSTISKVLNPYSQAKQLLLETTRAFALRILRKQKSYPGLSEIIEAFYANLLLGTPSAISTHSIIHTVNICEAIGKKLREVEAKSRTSAEVALEQLEKEQAPADYTKGWVLVTGGTGFLGRMVTAELRKRLWPVRVIARHIPSPSDRIPGVEYTAVDLGEKVPTKILDAVNTVVHCAAETAAGKEAHKRNTVDTTRNILNAMSQSRVKRFIHISSIAVLKTGRGIRGQINEKTSVDSNNEERGPYVWGKAESERIAYELSEKLGITMRVIRPGPLVDFERFEPPGRLGREIGRYFVAIGSRNSKLNICDVNTAAKVICYYVENFESAPQFLNLIEPKAPTRDELVGYFMNKRSDLKAFWVPSFVLFAMSIVFKILQKLLHPRKKTIDIRAIFASKNYNTDLANKIIKKAYDVDPFNSTVKSKTEFSIY